MNKINRLKELRERKGVSLKKLSDELKERYEITVSSSQLMYYEKGERQPRNEEIWQKLADYFGVSISVLLGYRDENDSLGFKLWSLRNQKGVELEKAAKDLRLSKEELQLFEKTDNLTLGDKLAKDFADYFGVTVDYLLGNSKIRDPKLVELMLKANSSNEKAPPSDTPSFEMLTQSDDENQLLSNYRRLEKPYKEQVLDFSKSLLILQRYHDKKDNDSELPQSTNNQS